MKGGYTCVPRNGVAIVWKFEMRVDGMQGDYH